MNQTGVGDAIVQEITIKATVERIFEALSGWDLEEKSNGITPVRLTQS